MTIKIDGKWFIDSNGRKIMLRGINLSGNSKVPYPNGATHLKDDFSNHKDISFIGRPFPLDEAKEHLERLKHWGFNFIRFIVTWEALEHSGPEQYDMNYINYVKDILELATEKYGFYVMIDPHQDVWSRMTGGDGAPGWLFEKFGLNLKEFESANCAWTMQQNYDESNPKAYGPQYWTQNKLRLPCATMFTLFYGGNDFAPKCTVDGIKAQNYLQNHYMNAIKKLSSKLKHIGNILGYSPINEPYNGWIGYKVDFSNFAGINETLGYPITPFDAMCIASGYPKEVGYRMIKKFGIKEVRKDFLNPDCISIWLDKIEPIWKKEGVWDLDENNNPFIQNNDYFLKINDKSVDFYQDYYYPFINNYAKTIQEISSEYMIFLTNSFEDMMKNNINLEYNFEFNNLINMPCWYDVATSGTNRPMIKASYNLMKDKPVIGKEHTQKMYIEQLKYLKNISHEFYKDIPTVIGEFNIPFNLQKGKAFKKLETDPDSAWDTHLELLGMYFKAMDTNLLNCVLWNYSPDNNNKFGDQWNLEDFSIFSRDQQLDLNDINSGARALKGFCRPYCVKCSGLPIKVEFDPDSKEFKLHFKSDYSIDTPSEIFVPKMQYPNGYNISIDGDAKVIKKEDQQLLLITSKLSSEIRITINSK